MHTILIVDIHQAAAEIWNKFVEFEQSIGDAESIRRAEARRAEALSEKTILFIGYIHH